MTSAAPPATESSRCTPIDAAACYVSIYSIAYMILV